MLLSQGRDLLNFEFNGEMTNFKHYPCTESALASFKLYINTLNFFKSSRINSCLHRMNNSGRFNGEYFRPRFSPYPLNSSIREAEAQAEGRNRKAIHLR